MDLVASALRVAQRHLVALRIQQLKKLLDSPTKEFAILTSELSTMGTGEKTTQKTEFVRYLMRKGYNKFVPLKASWENTKEQSVLVPGMTFHDAIDFGIAYKQDAVIHKHPSGVLGMYYPMKYKAIVAAKEDGDLAAEISANPDLYSKARGISFSFNFLWSQEIPWDMSRPITKDDLLRFIAEGLVKFE